MSELLTTRLTIHHSPLGPRYSWSLLRFAGHHPGKVDMRLLCHGQVDASEEDPHGLDMLALLVVRAARQEA